MVVTGKITPVGKETDRRWEPIDAGIHVYEGRPIRSLRFTHPDGLP
jgi:hypothetical protein